MTNVSYVLFNYNFWLNKFFDVLPYSSDAGTDYWYKLNVTVGILTNSALTFIVEKIIAVPFTAWYDRRQEKKQVALYAETMRRL